MGIFKKMTSALEKSHFDIFEKSKVERVEIAGIQLQCPHCGGVDFKWGKSQLNTAGLTLVDAEMINPTVSVYRCENCHCLQQFDNYDPDEWARTH